MIIAPDNRYGVDEKIYLIQNYIDHKCEKDNILNNCNIYGQLFLQEKEKGLVLEYNEKEPLIDDRVNSVIGFRVLEKELKSFQCTATIDVICTLETDNREKIELYIYKLLAMCGYVNEIINTKIGIRDVYSGLYQEDVKYRDIIPSELLEFSGATFAFKNTNPGVVNCDFADILSDYAPFVNLFVVNSSFYFADADIEDAQEWRDQIALNNIIPIYNSDDSEIDHEDPVRNTNIQDVEIEIYRGKYKFSLFFNYDNDLYNKIKELHNKPAYIYLQDKNNNMLSILDGTDNFGIRCDLFAVTKLILGDLSYPSGMRIDLTVDSEQDFNFTKLEFNQNALIYYPLQYFEEVGEPPPSVSYWEIQDCYIIQYGTSTVLGFLVTDSNNDEVTTGIILADVSIIDDTHGSQTIYSVSYDTDHWELECDKLPTSGYLYIDSPYGVINFNYDISSLY